MSQAASDSVLQLLLLSDTHIGFDHATTSRSSKVPRRGPDFLANFGLIVEKAISEKVDIVIHCGDVFEKPQTPDFLVDQTYAAFLSMATAGIQVVIVPGNHERSVLPTSLFLHHPNIHVFTRPETFQFRGLTVSGFPYYKGDIRSKFTNMRKDLETSLSDQDFNLLCVHHAIDGAKAGTQFFEFKNRPDTLNINDLPGRFDLVLSGHIHKYQKLKAHNEQGETKFIIYSGSTERTMFDEMDEVKGYHTFRIEGKKYIHQFHPIATRPMHRIDLKSNRMGQGDLKAWLSIQLKSIPSDAILQLQADQRDTLILLSNLKTRGFFPPGMHVTISGFGAMHGAANQA